METQSGEIDLGPLSAVPENGMQQYDLNGLAVVICRSGGTLHAIEGICPHRGAQLVQGNLEGVSVVCPWHDWEFDVETGRGITNPNSCLKTYQVSVREGHIILVLPCQ